MFMCWQKEYKHKTKQNKKQDRTKVQYLSYYIMYQRMNVCIRYNFEMHNQQATRQREPGMLLTATFI